MTPAVPTPVSNTEVMTSTIHVDASLPSPTLPGDKTVKTEVKEVTEIIK